MPRKRNYVKRKKGYRPRRRYRQRKRLVNKTSAISRNFLYRDSVVGKLNYQDYYTYNVPGGISIQQYRGNSVYDPDATGVGGQPTMFDQLAGLYNKYIVYASKIHVRVINTDNVPVRVVLIPTLNGTTFSSVGAAIDFPSSKYRLLSPSGSGGDKCSIVHYAKSANISNIKDIMDESSDLGAAVTNNPSKPWYWQLYFQNDDGGNLVLTYQVKITYYVKFYEPVRLADSV